MKNNICSICKEKDLSIEFSKIKELKIKKFINNNRVNKDDYSNMIKQCNCNEVSHKFCILLNIIFNYELKCQKCNTFYNITITQDSDKRKKCQIICLMISLFVIHIIFYGLCAVLIIFDLEAFKITKFKEESKTKYTYMQYFFALVIFIINTYLFVFTIKFINERFKESYLYFININEKSSKNKDDKDYFSPLYNFYKTFNNDKLGYLVYKRNITYFSNRIIYNKDQQNFIKKNNIEFQDLSNGDKKYPIFNKEEDILKLKSNN